MTDQADRKADVTRQQILYAASTQFAHTAYHLVSLDDILADAKVTKGAMYFHFRSKFALASAIVELHAENARVSVADILSRGLSGLETLVDITYYIAVEDIVDHLARATMNLLESVFRTHELQSAIITEWIGSFAEIASRAVDEGDIPDGQDPGEIAHMLVSMYLGIRQTSKLDEPERFIADLEKAWLLVLPGFAAADRAPFLRQFVKRRTNLAIRKVRTAATGEL